MPISKTEICNMALAHCGIDTRIQNVETDSDKNARQCRLFYDHNRRILLEIQRWGFASEQVALQDIGDAPYGWGYRYMYPNFAMRANHIVNPASRNPDTDSKIPYKIYNISQNGQGKSIVTDQGSATLDINRDTTDPSLFSQTFVQMLSFFLASHIATPLRIDPKITASVTEQFRFWMMEAGNNELAQEQEEKEHDSEFLAVRS